MRVTYLAHLIRIYQIVAVNLTTLLHIWRSLVHFLARKRAILTKGFHGFVQSAV
jgi:hypothetical protein